MNIKIIQHLMPWELDYALLSFTQFKKSKYHLSEDDNVSIETVLNLSSYIIDWNKSSLPKQFFIDKYNEISNLLVDYDHIKRIYDSDNLYGHLNLQKECISCETDYYIAVCPDIYFSEYLLAYMIEGAKSIKNEYFLITPQISKLWDSSWDVLVNPLYQTITYNAWNEVDTFDIINNDLNHDINLIPISQSKFAGWFDLYNKNFYEKLIPVWDDWEGYGSWDWYGMIVSENFKRAGGDFQQYILEGKTIFEYSVGPLKNGFTEYYKKYLHLNHIPDQREKFKSNVINYANIRLKQIFNK